MSMPSTYNTYLHRMITQQKQKNKVCRGEIKRNSEIELDKFRYTAEIYALVTHDSFLQHNDSSTLYKDYNRHG